MGTRIRIVLFAVCKNLKNEFPSNLYFQNLNLNFGKFVKFNFIFRFFLFFFSFSFFSFFLPIFFSHYFSMSLLIIHFNQHVSYFLHQISSQGYNIPLFSSTFSGICLFFISNGARGTALALKLSKSFNFQGKIEEDIEQLSLNLRKL